ncbi:MULTISPECIES: hypothetical protein [Rhodobacterales]|uniref:hypothetical protein n=1 Tax=Rhodobacterales TaxID=204455 RepID=UPI00405883F1
MRVLPIVAALLLSTGTASAEFAVSFNWGDIPLCTNGRPNRVGSPAFTIKDLPAGTTSVEFRLKDLDVPSYNHGGGKLKISGSGQLPFGAFKYKSPCPPGGSHTYEWTATAKAGNKVVGTAKARRAYPE